MVNIVICVYKIRENDEKQQKRRKDKQIRK